MMRWDTTGRMMMVAVAMMVAALGGVLRAQDSEGDADVESEGADVFMMIAERNIFNSRRTRRVEREERPVVEQRREPRVDSFALTGVIRYERGTFGFFDGLSDVYRKAVGEGDEIGGFKVVSLTPDEVTLEREGKTINVAVGEQLRREEEGEWELSKRTGGYGSRPGGGFRGPVPEGARNQEADAKAADDGDSVDVLKRLMEKRRKEMNQ